MADSKRGRTSEVKIRMFPEERNILEYKAGLVEKSLSDFIRDLILLSSVETKSVLTDKNFQKLLYEINRIGNNINQIAYNANLKKSTGKEEIYGLREQYSALLSLYEDTFLYPESEEEHGNNEES